MGISRRNKCISLSNQIIPVKGLDSSKPMNKLLNRKPTTLSETEK